MTRTADRSPLVDREGGAHTGTTNALPNTHPREVLREEFLVPLGLSQNRLARELGVPPRRINEIVLEKRAITADTTSATGPRFFGTSGGFWMSLQSDYDLERTRRKIGGRPRREIRPFTV